MALYTSNLCGFFYALMATDKKSFLLYADQQSVFKQLPDDIAGKLIKHIFSYVNDENPVTDELILNIAFEPIKQQLKRDLDKYESIRERNSVNARKRWDAVASFGIPKSTKNADNDNDNVNDNVNDTDNDNKEFETVWELYTRKGSKMNSQKKWNSLPKTKKEKIKDHLPIYIKNHIDNNKMEFLPHFTTYLNQEKWNDELPYKQTETVKTTPNFLKL